MKVIVITLLGLVALVASKHTILKTPESLENIIPYGYHTKIGLPLAEKIRQAEESLKINQISQLSAEPSARIVEGFAARLGDFPYQAGLIVNLPLGQSVCGGSLLSAQRVLTAAHCWNDGTQQGKSLTVVLGSVTLFSGGTRLPTSQVVMHQKYNPRTITNDIAMIVLPSAVRFSNNISPVALPSGSEINENFVQNQVVASGFGKTTDDSKISPSTYLSHATLQVISNSQCSRFFQIVQNSNICTQGAGRKNICGGDSGGPLVVARGNRRVLIGVSSFGSVSCMNGLPAAFTRVTSYMDWIKNLL